MNNGRTIKMFLVDGAPNGLLTAEIMNWTGHVITGPRSRLGELIQRPEARRTGVYFLVGPDSEQGIGTQVYIGETDEVAQRLTTHNRAETSGGKDFWEKVCVVTSKDANLTKGHVKYLESRLISVTTMAGRCRLVNGTEPQYENLPEADRSDMEFFIDQVRTLLPVLGFDFLRDTPVATQSTLHGPIQQTSSSPGPLANSAASPIFSGDLKKYEITARGQEIDGDFVVLKGSKARAEWEGVPSAYTGLFNELVRTGVLVPSSDGRHKEFSRDYAFSSPSAAAAVVTGRTANGRTHWVTSEGGQTYGAWQQANIDRTLEELESTPSAHGT